MTQSWRAACTFLVDKGQINPGRYLRSTHHVSLPITLLTNDNNLSMKAQANGILALSGLSPNNEPMSSDVLIRQVLNGPLPQEKTYIRPKEGEDTRMLDLSGTAEDKLPFLPGLEASRFAPKSQANGKMKPAIAIDPETGAVILLEEGQRPPNHHAKNYKELANLLAHGDTNFDVDVFGKHPEEGQTYADIMASRKEHSQRHSGDDEMEWE